MPEGAEESRARQVGTLRSLAHEMLTAEETVSLLEKASPESDIDSDLVRVVRRDIDKATRVPSSLIAEMAEASGRSKSAWMKDCLSNSITQRKIENWSTFNMEKSNEIIN